MLAASCDIHECFVGAQADLQPSAMQLVTMRAAVCTIVRRVGPRHTLLMVVIDSTSHSSIPSMVKLTCRLLHVQLALTEAAMHTSRCLVHRLGTGEVEKRSGRADRAEDGAGIHTKRAKRCNPI